MAPSLNLVGQAAQKAIIMSIFDASWFAKGGDEDSEMTFDWCRCARGWDGDPEPIDEEEEDFSGIVACISMVSTRVSSSFQAALPSLELPGSAKSTKYFMVPLI